MNRELALKALENLMQHEALDAIVLYDLITQYDCSDDWTEKDAFRKVICYYSTEEQYKTFKKERGIES